MRQASLVALLALLAASCGANRVDRAADGQAALARPVPAAARGPVRIVGTAMDATTGRPVAGARVVGPEGVEARSDGEGRFELRGLSAGSEGELRATTEDGRAGRNRIRPLRRSVLEVVVWLR
jgi:hypothetical protein